MFLYVNDIVEYEDGTRERILWIDESNIKLFSINLDGKKTFPEMKNVKDVIDEINFKRAKKLEEDNYFIVVDESKLSKKQIENRDRAWNAIKDIVNIENYPNIFNRRCRGSLIKESIEKNNIMKNTIYSYLRKYWIGGQVKNALIPNYYNCGGKGKEKLLGDKKTGRPKKHINELSKGINIDDDTKKIIEIVKKRHYYKNKKVSIILAYELMIEEFFTEIHIDENGMKLKKINEDIISLEQFRYWINKNKDIKEESLYRDGNKKYNLLKRPILGSSSQDAIYPGHMYQIDATKGDIYLVSRFDRNKIVGRPTIYLAVDVFSRMIVGVYIGLEDPSWIGTMMTLANCGKNKKEFCEEYGINIADKDWPIKHLPQTILADRGEMEGKNIETLINSLYVDVKNTPAYRGDLKGIVERKFREMHDVIKAFTPGFIETDFKERGAEDYRLEATLDIVDFTKIVIYFILHHNNEKFMRHYEREEMMIQDNVSNIPIEIWNWGIKNKGMPRSFSEKILMLNLMPKDRATVTRRGIKYKSMYYTCDIAISERWFQNAGLKGSWSIEISYDPRNMNRIYIRTNSGRDFITCTLLEKSKRYFDKTMEEIDFLLEEEKLNVNKSKDNVLESNINLNCKIKDIVANAKEKSDKSKMIFITKSEKIGNISKNKLNDKNKIRNIEAFNLDDNDKVISKQKNTNPLINNNSKDMDILIERRRRLKEKKVDCVNEKK